MKTLLIAIATVLFWVTPLWAECQRVTIDGEEKLLCDTESQSWDSYRDDPDWIPDITDQPRQRQAFPERRFQSGAGEVTVYDNGMNCVSKDINGQGLIQTDCY